MARSSRPRTERERAIEFRNSEAGTKAFPRMNEGREAAAGLDRSQLAAAIGWEPDLAEGSAAEIFFRPGTSSQDW